MYKQKIRSLLIDILRGKNIEDILPQVDYPADISHGDYATNIALVLSKKVQKPPLEIAVEIRDELVKKVDFADVSIAGPGFINLTLHDRALLEGLVTESSKIMTSEFTGKKVMVEYTDPNPFKELHIGHLYSNIVGESIARLLEKNGAEVKRACYQGDVGLHVAKSLWGMRQLLTKEHKTIAEFEEGISNIIKPQPPALDTNALKAKFLGESYAVGSAAFEEDEGAKAEIIEINKQVYVKDPSIIDLYTKGRAWSLEYFETIYEKLGTKFDFNFFESEVGEDGLRIVREYLAKGVFEESQGAVIFPGEKYGLHSRVFINSLGLPTYEAKELGLAPKKYEKFPYDLSIVITGNEVNSYFMVLLKALEQIRPDLAQKTKHFGHGMVRLPEGKMSSRKGNVVTGMSLINEASVRIGIQRYQLNIEEYNTGNETWELSTKIGIGAVKYALLKSGVGKDIEFSFTESISFEGNSGPYLQYTHARIQSVLQKAGNELKEDGVTTHLNAEEKTLLRHLVTFDEIVQMAAEGYSPSTIATYLYELAQKFNNFYQKHQIIDSEQKNFRLSLTGKVGETLKDGLYLLGIEAPEKM